MNLERFFYHLIVALFAPALAFAQPAAVQTLRVIVPLSAGSTTERLMRAAAPGMSAALGTPVTVEVLPGAGGVTGSAAVAKAPADGLTLLMATSGAFSVAPNIRNNVPYDPIRDFTPVCRFGGAAYVLVVNPSLGITSLSQLLAKARHQWLSFASSGVGSTPHFAQEIFKATTKTEFMHIPYRGAPEAISETIAGNADLLFETPGPQLGAIRSGRLRAIGIMSPRRLAALPEVPTFGELGYPELSLRGWVGLVAPAGTPTALVNRLASACEKTLKSPELESHAKSLGFEIDYAGPSTFSAYIETELRKWGEISQVAGIKRE